MQYPTTILGKGKVAEDEEEEEETEFGPDKQEREMLL